MKKILALLLALVMIFALAACGEASTDTSTPPADGDTPASEAPADDGAPPPLPTRISPLSGSTVSPPTAPPVSSTWPL